MVSNNVVFRILLCIFLLFAVSNAHATPNPVLPGTADVGVVRFNGQYYLMGVGTSGGFYISNDLVHWKGPHHVFSMDNEWATGEAGKDSEIHACDMALHNGQFNLYWSVNYGELRNIGRALSDTILGPYQEPVRNAPFDGRIDPQLFMDEDGACYFYTVKFTDGNVIYGQPMQDPATLSGEAVALLSAMSDTWEFMDAKVNEAPWVTRYRDRYYLLYNGNHTGSAYGNYGIGCAVSDTPLGFRNESKYPYPVLRDNWERIHENAQVISPLSRHTEASWKYVLETPAGSWMQCGYDDSAWQIGEGAFGNKRGALFSNVGRTRWSGSDIWMRRAFRWKEGASADDLRLFINHSGPAEVYINGVKACSLSGYTAGYALKPVTPEALATLKPGNNLLAVHVAQHGSRAQYVDAGLYLFRSGTAEPVIHNCGQPNLVRGPNGFEWWLVYFALYDGNPMRCQAIDRVHFFGRELVMMPPTSASMPGMNQLPAAASFMELFEEERLSDNWTAEKGQWHIEQGCLLQSRDNGTQRITLDMPPRQNFLFEAGVQLQGESAGAAGLVLYSGKRTPLAFVGIDRKAQGWFCMIGHERDTSPLPEGFNWDGWHAMRLLKNGSEITCCINSIPTSGKSIFNLADASSLRVGLFTDNAEAAFDGVVYTVGWDEYGRHIRGWGDSTAGKPSTGQWRVDENGMSVTAEDEESCIFKGDLLDNFEWSVQVIPANPTPESAFGVYGLYYDDDNYLYLSLNNAMNELTVIGSGEEHSPLTFPVRLRKQRLSSVEMSGLNLRVARIGGRVVIYVDGIETVNLSDVWPPAQAGLFAEKTECRFDSITFFDSNADITLPQQ